MDYIKDPDGTSTDENIISEIKNTLEGTKCRLDTVEKRSNELEDPAIQIIQNETQRENYWGKK